jgi:hypothetical protein
MALNQKREILVTASKREKVSRKILSATFSKFGFYAAASAQSEMVLNQQARNPM